MVKLMVSRIRFIVENASRNPKGFIKKIILYLIGFKQVRGHWFFKMPITTASIVFDFGANMGLFSAKMKDVYECNCYLFEPNQKLVEKIQYDKSKVICTALTGIDQKIQFHVSSNDEASSTIRNFQQNWKIDKTIDVEGLSYKTTLKKLGLENDCIDLIKVDIEGAELEFINSLDVCDVKNIKQISVEFHHWLNPSLYNSTKAAFIKMKSLGFIRFTDATSFDKSVEVVFVNEKKIKFSLLQNILLVVYRFLDYSLKA